MDGSMPGGRGKGRLPSWAVFLLLFLVGALGGALVFRMSGRGSTPSRPGVPTAERATETPRPLAPDSSTDRIETTSAASNEAVTGTDRPANAELDRTNDAISSGRRNAITQAAQKAGRSVVTVGVIQTRYVRQAPRSLDPFDLFFDRYLPGNVYEQRIPGMGSGIIVDPTGIVLTNEHVVRDATEIKVITSDGRNFPAKLVGSDPNWDLAVLKVDGEKLPYAEIGDSDDLVVGEWAIAIGNPFGFFLENTEPTVTVGVVSALHRDIKGDDVSQGIYKDMIQTDAAINPGNSGGALVNALGQVVGINTFIFTQGGGSLGIGFAIPINTAVRVARDLIKYGRERPVWIGFWARPIVPWMAAQLGLRDTAGLLVSMVEAGSPAARAGLQEGDVIREINGRRVAGAQEAIRTIFGVRPGDVITLVIERRGQRLTVRVEVVSAPTTGT